MSEFYCWSLIGNKQSACNYYRVAVPMGQLMKRDLAKVYLEEKLAVTDESRTALMYSDIGHFYAAGGQQILHLLKTLRGMQPAVRNGVDIYPPTLIYDIDDNGDFVHPFNMTFVHAGVRGYPDAKLLEPGDGLVIEDSKGKQIAAWLDQQTDYNGTKFDVGRNLFQMKVRHEIIRTCNGVTVPSPVLARYMRDVIGQKNVYVFPNTIVPDDYEHIEAVRKDDSVRILWQGGMSHWIDWYPLRDAVRAISQKYPNIKWVLFGEWFNWIHENIPDHMVEHHPWVDYAAYRLKRGLLNVDINLCPLVNNIFNACKSPIKWYEGSIWDRPEATLAQVSPTYSEIVDGKTGLLFRTPEEFVEKLSTLIEDASLRARLGASAREWVLANRTPEQTIPGLFDFYTELRAKHRRELGRPIIKQPTLDQIKKAGLPLR